MNELLNNEVVEETMENTAEVTETVAKKGIANVAVKAALIVGGVLLVRTIYKKVIKPKLTARKEAKKDCTEEIISEEE